MLHLVTGLFALSTFANAQLNNLAQTAGKLYFGTATDNPELTNTSYVSITSNISEFGQITPANSMKWDATEPNPGQFNFTGGQQIVDLAQGNSQIIRGHNCVWYQQLPEWVANGTFTPDGKFHKKMASVIQSHCSTIVGNWAGQIQAWDVVNEPFNDDGTFRQDVFFNALGQSYITIALSAAKAADASTLLFINEFNNEFAGPKSTALQNLVTSLKSAGTPLDAVGFQCHFIVGEVPTDFQNQLEIFASLGVSVAITELDVRMTLPATDDLLAQQQIDYQNVVAACMAVDACIGITVWDWTDKFSWVPGTFSGQGAACPYDENFVEKPAHAGIVNALSA